MPIDTFWLHATSKLSILHRQVLCWNLARRHRRLLRLRIRALQHATPRVVWFTAACLCLPEPSDTEEEELRDDVKRSDFPWLGEDPSVGASDASDEGQEDMDEYEEEDDGEEGKDEDGDIEMQDDALTPLFRCCSTREAMVVIMDARLAVLGVNPRREDLTPWEDTFLGMLEMFLNHLDEHCCPRSSAQAQLQDDNPERHQVCVSSIYMDRLQEEIKDRLDLIIDTDLRNDDILEKPSLGWSRWQNLGRPKSKARLMKSRGLGSPLVESCSPDEMVEYESGLDDTTMYDEWEAWVWQSWEEPPSAVGRARAERRVLVHDDTSARSNTGGESEVSSECTVKW
ncbi:hypothetical protein E4U42_006602 [Claviceps africana]|uniref:Uncharacterized protein n=1 Tax=Claviceps africana TaxID=83212 RepID=A0A8K0NGL5_9HYPO|nr:hypothetical protein E4U42_006602 [Claviceps africana]